MGHHCSHHHEETKNLGLVFFLNFGFSILELIGGIMSNSVALIADAIHDAGDALAIGLAWGLARLGNRKRNDKFSYGYRRLSLLSGLIASFILVVGALIMLWFGFSRISAPPVVRSEIMFGFAVLGVLVNGYAFWKTQHGKTMNERVISLHLLEDLLGWVAVLIGAVVIYFTDWYIVDALLAIGIAGWILIHGLQSIFAVLALFLQSIPDDINVKNLEQKLLEHPKIESIHDLHVWSLDGDKNVASCHVVLKDLKDQVSVKSAVKKTFADLGIGHVTVEIEIPEENCEGCNC